MSSFTASISASLTAEKLVGKVRGVQDLPQSFEHYYVSMGLRNGSPMRESINRAMLKIMVTQDWNRLLVRHLAAEP